MFMQLSPDAVIEVAKEYAETFSSCELERRHEIAVSGHNDDGLH